MKLTLVLAALMGFGTAGAVAQIEPGDPSGNQTIPEKDLSRPAGKPSLSDQLDKSRSGDHEIASRSRSKFYTRHPTAA